MVLKYTKETKGNLYRKFGNDLHFFYSKAVDADTTGKAAGTVPQPCLCQMAQQQIISRSYEHTFASVSSSAMP